MIQASDCIIKHCDALWAGSGFGKYIGYWQEMKRRVTVFLARSLVWLTLSQ